MAHHRCPVLSLFVVVVVAVVASSGFLQPVAAEAFPFQFEHFEVKEGGSEYRSDPFNVSSDTSNILAFKTDFTIDDPANAPSVDLEFSLALVHDNDRLFETNKTSLKGGSSAKSFEMADPCRAKDLYEKVNGTHYLRLTVTPKDANSAVNISGSVTFSTDSGQLTNNTVFASQRIRDFPQTYVFIDLPKAASFYKLNVSLSPSEKPFLADIEVKTCTGSPFQQGNISSDKTVEADHIPGNQRVYIVLSPQPDSQDDSYKLTATVWPETSKGSSKVAVIVIAVILCLGLAAAIVFFVVRRRRNRSSRKVPFERLME